jgi:hypothetical protein
MAEIAGKVEGFVEGGCNKTESTTESLFSLVTISLLRFLDVSHGTTLSPYLKRKNLNKDGNSLVL